MRYLALIPLLSLISCATMISGRDEQIAVDSSPSGANASLTCADQTTRSGITPVTMTMPRKAGTCTLDIAKEGFNSEQVRLTPGMNGRYWVNFVTSPLVPLGIVGFTGIGFSQADAQSRLWGSAALLTVAAAFAIDHVTGAMYEHEPKKVRVELKAK